MGKDQHLMMQKIEFVWKSIVFILVGTVVGTALLTMTFLVPTNPKNMQSTYEILEKEGWYPAMPVLSQSLDTFFDSNLPGVLDDDTDALMLHTAMETEESNPLYAALDMKGYSYYWHGYVCILRPLLALFDYGEIRFLNCVLQMLLVFGLMYLLMKQKGKLQALLLFASYVFLMPMAMQMSLQFSWVFYITYVGLFFLMKNFVWCKNNTKLYFFFMFLGMATSFLDLLTYPLYTWAIPMIWLIVLEDERGWDYYVKQVIGTGCSWLAGYAGLWIGKWLIGSLVLKRNILQEAIEEVFFRAGVKEGVSWGMSRLEAMYTNWKHYEYKLYFLLLAVWVVWIIYRSVKNGCKYNPKSWSLLLIAASSAAWYFVLYNHTQIHHFFTYRIWGISITALLVFWCECLQDKESKRCTKQKLASMLCWGMVVVCSAGLALLAKEDISVINGDKAYYEQELSGDDIASVEFVPSFSRIKQIGMGIRTESKEGECIISIYDQDALLYSESIALSEMGDGTYISLPVHWKLKAGKTYTTQISTRNSIGKTYLLITDHGEMPLSEYPHTAINGEPAMGQPISGIVYRSRPLSRMTLLFLLVSWTGVVGALFLQLWQGCLFLKAYRGKQNTSYVPPLETVKESS